MRKQTLKNSRRLVGRRTYTAGELILILKIHRQTLRTWRKFGLAPIFTESADPTLIAPEVGNSRLPAPVPVELSTRRQVFVAVQAYSSWVSVAK